MKSVDVASESYWSISDLYGKVIKISIFKIISHFMSAIVQLCHQ